MMKCEDVQKELEAFFSNDIDDTIRTEIQNHLDECQDCSRALRKLTGLSEVLKTWRGIEPSPIMYEKLKARVEAHESFWGRIFTNPFVKKAIIQFVEVTAIVALTLLVSHLLHKPNPEIRDDLATINFYLTEHQEAVAQTISTEPTRPEMRMYMNRDDIIYYESMGAFPESARHGIILRRPSSQRETYLPKAPVISNGRVLTLAQARNAVNFNTVMPTRLYPAYILDSIRKIDGHDSLHLLYTNGVDTVSLFEQSPGDELGLAAQDFREYAVYRSKEQGGGTILAWRNDAVSFVLIGKVEMSQLMDMAQFISAANQRR